MLNTKYIPSWPSKGLSDEIIKPPTTSDNSLNSKVSYYGSKARLEFRGSCLKQNKSTLNHGKIVNTYIVYELNKTYIKSHKYCLSLHYNGANSYLFVNGTEIIKFKAKDSKTVASPLCLGNI